MAWTSPPAWTPGQLVGATDMAILSNDLNYLLNRPSQTIKRNNAADYTTTSATFVDIDGTNLAITLTLSGSAALVSFTGVVYSSIAGSGSSIVLDINVDGTRFNSGSVLGSWFLRAPGTTTGEVTAALAILVTGLAAGSHTFKPQWFTSGNTAHLYSSGSTHLPVLSVVEVA